MKKVQHITVRIINRIISSLLIVLGFTGCSSDLEDEGTNLLMYGTPNATYSIKGKVISAEDLQPLQDLQIEISMSYGADYWQTDTLQSDQQGEFEWAQSNTPNSNDIRVITSVPDVSPEQAAFLPDTTFVSFKGVKFTGGDGMWYKGKAEVKSTIRMKKNPDQLKKK